MATLKTPLTAADLPALLDTLRAKGASAVKLRLTPSGAVVGLECVLSPLAPAALRRSERPTKDDFVPPPAPAGLGYT